MNLQPSALLISTAQQWVLCEDGRIIELGTDTPPSVDDALHIDLPDGTILPGFIDIHIHGAMGHDTMDGTTEALQGIARFLAQHGVTSFLATTWTDTHEAIVTALRAIKANMGPISDGAMLLGAHLEGPYLNPNKCGAQDKDHIRTATRAEVDELLAIEAIKVMSIAPEYDAHLPIIDLATASNIVVSAAHTNATYDDMVRAIRHGMTHTTHTYNAMRPLHHREPGTVGAALLRDELVCELIADNYHVDPIAMKLLWQNKGVNGIILVSDAVSAAGLNVAQHNLGGRMANVDNATATIRLENGTLAGSLLTLDRAICNFAAAVDEPVATIWPTTSLNAARSLKLDHRKGRLAVDYDADLVVLDTQCNVQLTVAMGNIVYRGDTA